MNSHAEKKYIFVLIVAAGCLGATSSARPAESVAAAGDRLVQFDPTFLADHSVDVRRFERANTVLPGTYTVDFVVNDQPMARREVQFVADVKGQNARPCLTLSLLRAAGVDMRQLGLLAADEQKAPPQPEQCIDLSKHIAEAAVHYDAGEQQLTLSIPQAALQHIARDEVDPSLWSDGITAGLLSYDANVYRTSGSDSTGTTGYVGLIGGINFGGWRLRQRSSLNYNENTEKGVFTRGWANLRSGTRFEAIETYAQHDLTLWKSTLTLGDRSC